MKKLALIVFLFAFVITKAQPSYLMNNTNVALACPGTSLFYDSGGSGGNYNNNETFTKTFTAPAGSCIMVSFGNTYSSESCCDFLQAWDGPNTASPWMGSWSGTSGPGTLITSGNSITFNWTSDISVVSTGWAATITCMSACSGTPSPGTAVTSVTSCAGGGTVTLADPTVGTGCGITYQWQSASVSTGPFSAIAGATVIPYTTSYAANTCYRLKVTCGANSAFSNTVCVTTATAGGACSLSTYNAAAVAYSWDNFAGTVCAATDDVIYNNIALFGFPFCYTGAQYFGGYIASNGAFVFPGVPCYPNILGPQYAAPGISTGWSITQAAPSQVAGFSSTPQNAILAPWHDIDPSLGGTIRYGVLGVAPNRRFVVSFEGIPMFSCGVAGGAAQYFWAQIKLFETSNNIEIHVQNKQLCATWNGGYAIMGLESYDGTIYRPPVNAVAHNYPTNWTMTNTAYRWTSACASTSCVVLPINFKSFYGERVETVNNLYWETSEETNVSHFIVERSTDAINFTEVGRVSPRNVPSKYHFADKTTMPGVMYYYKVTSVEKNGGRMSTEIYPLGSSEGEVSVSGIFPNPAKSDITIGVDSKTNTSVIVNIYNAWGKAVKTFTQDVTVGMSSLNLYIGDIDTGIYIVEITTPRKEIVSKQKLIKVN